jgi:SM-20-related protein
MPPRIRSPKPTGKSRLIAEPSAVADLAVARIPKFVPAQIVVVDEFLSTANVAELIRYALAHESDFEIAKVISRTGVPITNGSHRRSRVFRNIGQPKHEVVRNLRSVLPCVLKRLRHRAFRAWRVDVQMTASNHGDFFRLHKDRGEKGKSASREITFVYFFRSRPGAFRGGELRIYNSRFDRDEYVSAGTYKAVTPKHNRAVFFPSSLLHEVMPVHCPSRAFADSRFTVNGWFRRNPTNPRRNSLS